MAQIPKIIYTAPNHMIISLGDDVWFMSYTSVIAHIQKQEFRNSSLYFLTDLYENYNYSPTTTKHLHNMIEAFTKQYRFVYSIMIKPEQVSTNSSRFIDYRNLINLSDLDRPHRNTILKEFFNHTHA